MMNQGLEALANLASASPPSPAWSGIVTNNLTHNSNNQKTTNENPPFPAHGSNGDALASSSSGSTAAAPVRSHHLLYAYCPVQTPPNGNSSQWQQALQQGGGNGMNPSVLSNSNLALIMGMQQRQSQSQPQAGQVLDLLQQQLSYYRYNMRNSSQSEHLMATVTRDRGIQEASTTALEPHHELALSLAIQAHQSEQQNGKSLVSTLSSFMAIEIHCEDWGFYSHS
jgi:hypothetical protein